MSAEAFKNTSTYPWLRSFVPFAILLSWLAFFYQGTFGPLWAFWQTDEYSHAPLLVLIAFLWGLRLLQSQKTFTPSPSQTGNWLLFAGLTLGLISKAVSNHWIEQISLVVSLSGVLGLYLGRNALFVLLPPLGLLFLTIPVPPTLAPALTAKMQLLSSDLGVAGLHLLGLSAFQEGNVIEIGTQKLFVAEACSGLRYLFPLLGLGYLVVFHAFETPVKRLVLFLSTFPIALFSNGARITATGIIADRFGYTFIEGTMHEVEGFAVFAFCLLCFAGAYALLNVLSPEKRKEPRQLLPRWPAFSLVQAPKLQLPLMGGLLFIVLLSALGLSSLHKGTSASASHRDSFLSFPLHVHAWAGVPGLLSSEELKSLRLDDYALVNYTAENTAHTVNFYAAYYASQEQGRSIHSPEICLPGGGWETESRAIHATNVPDKNGQFLKVTREVVRKENSRQLVYYWFNEAGRNAPDNWRAKVLLLKSALSTGRTDGALLRVVTPLGPKQDPEEVDKILEAFLAEVVPLLPAYIP